MDQMVKMVKMVNLVMIKNGDVVCYNVVMACFGSVGSVDNHMKQKQYMTKNLEF